LLLFPCRSVPEVQRISRRIPKESANMVKEEIEEI
jgi:hypothetical protein